MRAPLPISNYTLGIFIAVLGAILVLKGGPDHSHKYRSEYPAKLIGIALLGLAAWTVVREFRRRRRPY